jgi:hypothetical protein
MTQRSISIKYFSNISMCMTMRFGKSSKCEVHCTCFEQNAKTGCWWSKEKGQNRSIKHHTENTSNTNPTKNRRWQNTCILRKQIFPKDFLLNCHDYWMHGMFANTFIHFITQNVICQANGCVIDTKHRLLNLFLYLRNQ